MELSSSRFSLKPLTQEHFIAIHSLWSSPGVRKYLWDDQVIPQSQTESILQKNKILFEQEKFGLWGAWDKNTTLVGFVGFWYFREPPELEILYGVREASWGQKIAPEITQVILDYGFQILKFPKIVGSTDNDNRASIVVMKRLGFQFQERKTIEGLDTLFYELFAPV